MPATQSQPSKNAESTRDAQRAGAYADHDVNALDRQASFLIQLQRAVDRLTQLTESYSDICPDDLREAVEHIKRAS